MKQLNLQLKQQTNTEPETDTTLGPAFSEYYPLPGRPGKKRRSGKFQWRMGVKIIPIDRAFHQHIKVQFSTTSFTPQIHMVPVGGPIAGSLRERPSRARVNWWLNQMEKTVNEPSV
jgi:hypothetical protein